MAFMGEVAWVRLERRRRRRGCAVVVVVVVAVAVVVVVVGNDETAAPLIDCGDCCIGVVCPSSPCCIDNVGVVLLLSLSRLRRNVEAMNSLISTSIIDSSSGSAIGDEGEGDDRLNESSAASESHEDKSEPTVSRRCRRGVYGARRPEEKKEE